MHELLVPAGDMECLKQAIHNGADAVYVGLKSFGARKFARNFNSEEIKDAINLCHLYGVKIYVTMNTLVKDNEVEDFLNQIEFLHKSGVDAVIMQDFGMICLVREKYPNLEIHASTQANNSSIETAKLFYELGVKRIVLSRELSLDEIKKIDVPIEKEVFIHGALCISYSGRCLMSSMIGNRSGNRGECAGSCRLPYSLEYRNKIISKEKYLISTKELNISPRIKELLATNICSFKIEGRMKSKEYVGNITRFYRNLIDQNQKFNLEEETDKLKTIYNREFTTGHLFKVTPTDLMNIKTPNHIGLPIGKVIEITPKRIKIKLNKSLNQLDGIRFIESGKGLIVNYLYDEKNNLVSSSDNICYIDNKIDLKTYDTVSKTLDYKLMKEIDNIKEKKIPINIELTANISKPLLLKVSDSKNNITISGSIVEKSITSPIDRKRIEKQLDKLGNTPFISNNIKINQDDDIFISIKELNELRREAVNKLIESRIKTNQNIAIKKVSFDLDLKQEHLITAKVKTEEQLLKCKELGINIIYVDNEQLYNKYLNDKNIYYILPKCSLKLSSLLKDRNLTNDYLIPSKDIIGDYGLNVYNIYTAYYLYKMGLTRITISPELTKEEVEKFIQNFKEQFNILPNIEMVCYGRIENMLIKDNILSINENDYNYQLIDLRKRYFPVYFDGKMTHILNYENKEIELIDFLKNKINIRLEFYDETKDLVEKTVNKYL